MPPSTPSASGRITIKDVASLAGVSTATADRVLNQRPGVRTVTVQKVLKAAQALHYLPDNALPDATAAAPWRLAFVLPQGNNPYLRMLADTIGFSESHQAPFNVKCEVHYVESFNPEALARTLLRLGKRVDAIAFMALEHPAVREAVNELAARGIPVLTVISDLANCARLAYVGLDNRSAGRTAAYLLARFMGTKAGTQIALIAGSLNYLAHEERERGFLQLHAEQFPEVEMVGVRESYDDSARNYHQTKELLERYPRIGGIYNIGGSSDGVGRALQEARLEQKVVFIGHGLTPDTRALLINGTMDAVITQSHLGIIMSCIRIICNLRDHRDLMTAVDIVRSQIIFRENLP
ncbi:LacI family DNA-binding transcriptional regulator [Comamonas sp. J-3]|uniref:LacI family DNA-binding transcriptional regulator n=1 Tax=Comamonas trifloxystrobinivorans TaxID=3350256 RepID=UPI00372CBBFA